MPVSVAERLSQKFLKVSGHWVPRRCILLVFPVTSGPNRWISVPGLGSGAPASGARSSAASGKIHQLPCARRVSHPRRPYADIPRHPHVSTILDWYTSYHQGVLRTTKITSHYSYKLGMAIVIILIINSCLLGSFHIALVVFSRLEPRGSPHLWWRACGGAPVSG